MGVGEDDGDDADACEAWGPEADGAPCAKPTSDKATNAATAQPQQNAPRFARSISTETTPITPLNDALRARNLVKKTPLTRKPQLTDNLYNPVLTVLFASQNTLQRYLHCRNFNQCQNNATQQHICITAFGHRDEFQMKGGKQFIMKILRHALCGIRTADIPADRPQALSYCLVATMLRKTMRIAPAHQPMWIARNVRGKFAYVALNTLNIMILKGS